MISYRKIDAKGHVLGRHGAHRVPETSYGKTVVSDVDLSKIVLMVKSKVPRTLQPSRNVILVALVDKDELN